MVHIQNEHSIIIVHIKKNYNNNTMVMKKRGKYHGSYSERHDIGTY